MRELIVEVVKYGASRGSALAIEGHIRRHGWKLRRIGVDQRWFKLGDGFDLHVAVPE